MQRKIFSPDGLTVIAGPCVIESLDLTLRVAESLRDITSRHSLTYIFKSSFDKANRTSLESYRGPGLEKGLEVLRKVREEVGVPVLTDFHEPRQAVPAAEVADVLQVPAFLCRQTDMLLAAGKTGKPVNLKKGQFVAPWDMKSAVEKVQSTGCRAVSVTERGTFFGYNRLVVDFRSLSLLREIGVPIVMDVTHSLQEPSATGRASGGERRYVPNMARAAVAWGCDGLFIETHPAPDEALCDGPNSLPLDQFPALLEQVLRVREACNNA